MPTVVFIVLITFKILIYNALDLSDDFDIQCVISKIVKDSDV
jgi:hypothetical protein